MQQGEKIAVPSFGMDGNPESLEARRRVITEAAGLDPDDWEEATYLVDTPTQKQDYKLVREMYEQRIAHPDAKIRVEFRCVMVPTSKAWTTVPAPKALRLVADMCNGDMWVFESFRVILPRPKFIPFKRPKRYGKQRPRSLRTFGRKAS